MTQRTALVTGAAAGIGRAITSALVARGWRVGAFDIDESGLATLSGSSVLTGRLDTIPLADQQRAVEVNVTGVLNGCHTAYPYLRATPGAQVVNLCSASAIYGQPELATYSATKFAVRGLTEALDLEWEDDDITVTAIWPLFVNTAMVDGMDVGAQRRLGVRLTPEDVAAEVMDVVEGGGRLSHRVHRAVGAPAKAMLAASAMSPSWLNRLVNARITR
jgi:NAD(P)-dependent dehydrogenase (short-subunit alcohol dehydrogenase family)